LFVDLLINEEPFGPEGIPGSPDGYEKSGQYEEFA
jgi:hypothetical protein